MYLGCPPQETIYGTSGPKRLIYLIFTGILVEKIKLSPWLDERG
jgi:hypothetical protein